MPMYYFSLRDRQTLVDSDGTNLPDVPTARAHAADVARELTFRSAGMLDESWSAWTMTVHDDNGTELFSLALSDFQSPSQQL